ncbi:MAG: hypothetical protein FJ087_17875 [Deltaproteobacteria bacterium]|nr:hypothetical protein [Deltaproteobacteria bacterium]
MARGFITRPWQPLGSLKSHHRTWRIARRSVVGRGKGAPSDAGLLASPGEHRTDHVQCLSTNLLDVDVIQGATPLLLDLLASVRKHLKPEVVLVNRTCVPQLTGDDVRSVVESENGVAPYRLLYRDQSTRDGPFESRIAMMEAAFRDAPPVERGPGAVNLVGFVRGRDREELGELVEALGVRGNAWLVPDVAPSAAVGYLRAPVHVVCRNPGWDRLYDRIVRPLDIRTVEVPLPYGVKGTLDFLLALAEGLERPDLAARVRAEAEEWEEHEWRPRTARTSGHRLGIVVEERGLHRLAGGRGLWSLPLVPLLREMGFGIALAVVEEPGRAGGAERAREAAGGACESVAAVAAEADLEDWLATSGVGPVFSDFQFDDRIVSRGHATFSARVFERGRAGSVRAIERLLDLARTRCYREHGWAFARR